MPAAEGKKVALIAGRTADNPSLLEAVVAKGCGTVYLEKPGAPTVAELETMAAFADAHGAKVYMGYNKNVTKYVTLALACEAAHPGAVTAFHHNNTYTQDGLPECFERCAEGMLKNMAVHELCLAVTFYGVTADAIAAVEADKEYSSCQTLTSNGKSFTDFVKLGFTVTTNAGKTVRIYADRCGGTHAEAIVSAAGVEVGRFRAPDDELAKDFDAKQAAHPDWMPYFLLNHSDYVTLKERVCAAALMGSEPEGVATLAVAVETLKVAEHLTTLLQKLLAAE
jgi:predicted dehydrogenase